MSVHIILRKSIFFSYLFSFMLEFLFAVEAFVVVLTTLPVTVLSSSQHSVTRNPEIDFHILSVESANT